jgi:hypothetical protein
MAHWFLLFAGNLRQERRVNPAGLAGSENSGKCNGSAKLRSKARTSARRTRTTSSIKFSRRAEPHEEVSSPIVVLCECDVVSSVNVLELVSYVTMVMNIH